LISRGLFLPSGSEGEFIELTSLVGKNYKGIVYGGQNVILGNNLGGTGTTLEIPSKEVTPELLKELNEKGLIIDDRINFPLVGRIGEFNSIEDMESLVPGTVYKSTRRLSKDEDIEVLVINGKTPYAYNGETESYYDRKIDGTIHGFNPYGDISGWERVQVASTGQYEYINKKLDKRMSSEDFDNAYKGTR
jgi:hypothetical protein